MSASVDEYDPNPVEEDSAECKSFDRRSPSALLPKERRTVYIGCRKFIVKDSTDRFSRLLRTGGAGKEAP